MRVKNTNKNRGQIELISDIGSPGNLERLTACSPLHSLFRQTSLTLAVCAILGFGGVASAEQASEGKVKSVQVSQREIIEKIDGKDANVTVREVTFQPGQKDSSHRHAGPVFGYVLEGEYEHAINDEPVKTYKAGETFYEPTGCLHRVAQNPSSKNKTRLLAVILHPRDTKQVTIRDKE